MNTGSDRQDLCEWRIIIAGTGGQGILTAARVLCELFVERGHHVVSGQLHGMAQRGGSVEASVMIDCGMSPVMSRGRASIVLGFEPVETARVLPFMSSRTMVVMNTAPIIPFVLGQHYVLKTGESDYPDLGRLVNSVRGVTPCVFPFDATRVAVEAGSEAALNMVMLGFLFGFGLLPYSSDVLWDVVVSKMPPAMVKTSSGAYQSGVTLGRESRASRQSEPRECQNGTSTPTRAEVSSS